MVSTAPQDAIAPRTDPPAILWNKVLEARAAVTREGRGPSDWKARDNLLAALEAYAANLTAHHRPIPYALRDELRIRRLMGHG